MIRGLAGVIIWTDALGSKVDSAFGSGDADGPIYGAPSSEP